MGEKNNELLFFDEVRSVADHETKIKQFRWIEKKMIIYYKKRRHFFFQRLKQRSTKEYKGRTDNSSPTETNEVVRVATLVL